MSEETPKPICDPDNLDYEGQKQYLRDKGWIPKQIGRIEYWKDPEIPDCYQPFGDAFYEQRHRDGFKDDD